MKIKVINNGTHRLIAVDYGYHIEKNGEDFGQRSYLADDIEQINADISNGIYTVVSDDGSPVPEEFDYESAYNELVEVIENG